MATTTAEHISTVTRISSNRTRNNHAFLSRLWYWSGLFAVTLLPMLFTWNHVALSSEKMIMGGLCALVYMVTLINRNQTKYYRAYRAIGLSAFYITVGFVVTFTLLAGFRLYYSRLYLGLSYLLCIAWYGSGMVLFPKSPLKLLTVKGGFADHLHPFARKNWQFVDSISDTKGLQSFDRIAIDFDAHENTVLSKKLATPRLSGIPIIDASWVYEQFSGRTPTAHITKDSIVRFSTSTFYETVKRLLDIMFVCVLSLLCLPLIIISAVIIKCESEGPVLFSQERVGRNEELFRLFKFRSMSHDAEKDGAKFAKIDDARITRYGKFIRKFRIDEIPQLWNVLKGDMSLIGPRPEQLSFAEFFDEEIPFYSVRHRVRPGITGWAQVKDGYANDLEGTRRKLEHDLYYIKNMSLSIDLLIIYATVRTVLTGFGSR